MHELPRAEEPFPSPLLAVREYFENCLPLKL